MSDSVEPNRKLSLKLKVVSPRFWPFMGASEHAIADLAEAIADIGAQVEVLTAGWEKKAPATFGFHNFSVQRFFRSPSNPFGSYRYQNNLRRYLINDLPGGLFFLGAVAEFQQLVGEFSGSLPIVLQLQDYEIEATDGSAQKRRFVSNLKLVDRLLVETQSTADRFKELGVNPKKIEVVPVGVNVRQLPERTESNQRVSRQAISAAHPMMHVAYDQPLAVCGASMAGDKGMLDLVAAWKLVLRKLPQAKLWVFGNGPKSRRVWEAIDAADLKDSIVMPGQFDDLSDIFQAANLYIHPLRSGCSCSILARAMASKLRPVVTQGAALTMGIEHEKTGVVVPPAQPADLAATLVAQFVQPQSSDLLGAKAAELAIARYDVSRVARAVVSAIRSSHSRR